MTRIVLERLEGRPLIFQVEFHHADGTDQKNKKCVPQMFVFMSSNVRFEISVQILEGRPLTFETEISHANKTTTNLRVFSLKRALLRKRQDFLDFG